MKRAVIFPGQGSQKVGMGRDWAEALPSARDAFEEADEVLRDPADPEASHHQGGPVGDPANALLSRGDLRAHVRGNDGVGGLVEQSVIWLADNDPGRFLFSLAVTRHHCAWHHPAFDGGVLLSDE